MLSVFSIFHFFSIIGVLKCNEKLMKLLKALPLFKKIRESLFYLIKHRGVSHNFQTTRRFHAINHKDLDPLDITESKLILTHQLYYNIKSFVLQVLPNGK